MKSHSGDPRHSLVGAAALTLAAVGALTTLSACRGQRSDDPPRQFLPDMDDQAKWKPQSESEFFENGRTMRLPPAGAVAFGVRSSDDESADRERVLKEDDAYFRGVDAAGDYVDFIPASVKVDADLIKRGQQRFNIYCSVCHGYLGDGKGMVGQRWVTPLPTWHDAKYRDRAQRTGKDGYLFHVVRNGVVDAAGIQKMPSYGHAVNEADAWAIVAYLRTLQATHAEFDSLPAATQQELLKKSRPPETAPVADQGVPASAAGGGTKP